MKNASFNESMSTPKKIKATVTKNVESFLIASALRTLTELLQVGILQ